MQYCSLQRWILLLSPVTSTAGYCFCFGSIPSFFLELFLHWSPVAYWAPNDLNQIPYDYTVEMRNRFKGLYLIDRVPDELWNEVRDIVQETDQDHPQKKEMQKSRMAVWGGLTKSCEKKKSKKQGEKETYKHPNTEFQRIARRDKKAFLNDQCKEIEENNRMEWREMSSRKLEIEREHFMQRWAW